jgi:hypothetical protein
MSALVTSADIGDSFPIPRYDDYQARATLSLRKDEEIAATFLASDDHLREPFRPATPPICARRTTTPLSAASSSPTAVCSTTAPACA